MAQVVTMPQLGESVTEGTIGTWLKKEGDTVEEYESLLEVLTDKVNAEVPSPKAGKITKILVQEGETVPIGTPICEMEVEGEEAEETAAPAAVEVPPAAESKEAPAPARAEPSTKAESGRGRYSPAVRRLAKEHGIDPAAVNGSGAGGRVTRNDILKAAESGPAPTAKPAQAAPGAKAMEGAPAVIAPEDTVVPLSSVRKVIAERMARSKQTVPHAWIMVETDVSGLVALRARIKDAFKEQHGFSLTYLPFMLRATVEALRAVPILNAQWNGDSVVMKKRIHLGMAAATERGLIVPVVKDADEKNLVGLARACQDLAARARTGQLKMEDISGGTFTVDNTGAVGTMLTYPVINAPEVGIVTMESIVRRPVVIGEGIAIRSMVNLCLSFDHRVVDGAEAAQFLQVIKRHLESLGPDSSVY